jgi:hypothetical protein
MIYPRNPLHCPRTDVAPSKHPFHPPTPTHPPSPTSAPPTTPEVEVDEQLTARRAAQPGFITPSFPTIAGAGPNGAIIHYRAQPGTCRCVCVCVSARI